MLLSLILSLSSFLAGSQAEWSWKVFPESQFKVLSPYELEHKATEIPGAGEPLVLHQYFGGSLNDTSLHLALVIDHYQLTAEEIGGDEEHLNEFFGVTVDQILKSVGGSLVYMDFTTYSDKTVCVWRGTFHDKTGIIRGHLVITGDKYYGLQAFGLADEKPDAMMHKFFESFQIIN